MIWLLRLFRAFRELEAKLAEAGDRAIALQDRASKQDAIISELRSMLTQSREDLIDILKQPAAVAAPMEPQKPMIPRGIQARDYVRLMTEQYHSAVAEATEHAADEALLMQQEQIQHLQ